MTPKTFDEWLSHIETLHAQTIDLGLDRMNVMLKRLQIRFDCPVFTVGGTNGKGSTCAFIENALLAGGYSVGVHTSPHLIRFNERVRLNGKEASDEELTEQFKKVEETRGDMTLSYFEYTLLAILLFFMKKKPDALVLEIGLGGRLDAVNTVEPTVSVITSIGLDHTAYLGKTRESVGWEKAHIYRPGKPAVCADPNPPITVGQYVDKIGAQLLLIGKDFGWRHEAGNSVWDFYGAGSEMRGLPVPSMLGEHQLSNASGAFEALLCVRHRLPLERACFEQALLKTKIPGRFSMVRSKPGIYLDVGHNPHAAVELAKTLDTLPQEGRKLAVFGMLSDKDRAEVCRILASKFDLWFAADLGSARGGRAAELQKFLTEEGVDAKNIKTFPSVRDALTEAIEHSSAADKIIIFGSFLTVAAAMDVLKEPVS